jgi:hypothetical protein
MFVIRLDDQEIEGHKVYICYHEDTRYCCQYHIAHVSLSVSFDKDTCCQTVLFHNQDQNIIIKLLFVNICFSEIAQQVTEKAQKQMVGEIDGLGVCPLPGEPPSLQ